MNNKLIFRICIPVAIVALIIVIIEVVFLTNIEKTTTVEKGEPEIKQLSDEEIEECFNIEYLDDGTISLSNYIGDYTDIKIPETYKGTEITKIGYGAFEYCTALTEIDCKNVTSIGDWAFEDCTSLTKIDCPKVKTIGNGAFEYCESLTKIDCSSVETIGDYAFYYCTSLTEIDCSSVTSIGDYAFYECESLKNVPTVK